MIEPVQRIRIKLPWWTKVPMINLFPGLIERYFNYMETWRWCWKCRRFTRHFRCVEYSSHKYFCLRHCDWDQEGDWETGYYDIPLCPKCLEEEG